MLVVAEKPSVARVIRAAVRPKPAVLALRGHILELSFPEKYSKWEKVDPHELFRAPVYWTVKDRGSYRRLCEALRGADSLVLATDNDPEGELIAYEALLAAKRGMGRALPYRRMRFNAATPRGLTEAWGRLEPELRWGWVWKALFRCRFDLVTGAAYTRLLTLSRVLGNTSRLVSWGSCQTPTLWFVFRREMEARGFKPEAYYIISAVLDAKGAGVRVSTEPIRGEEEARRLYGLARAAKQARAVCLQARSEEEAKPLPTDTDTMLQELTRIMGASGAKIMAVAEGLYGGGYISYPRTETDIWVGVNHEEVLAMLSSTPLGGHIDLGAYSPKSGRRSDGAHPPIHPTAYYARGGLKGKVWEYVARRYLANTTGRRALLATWRLGVDVGGVSMWAEGRYIIDEGFYAVFPYFKPTRLCPPPRLSAGEALSVEEVRLERRETEPPRPLTEPELLKLLKRHSIGTDATRSDYPRLIVERGYAEVKGRSYRITELGELLIRLLEEVDSRLVTPDTRRYVERLMGKLDEGSMSTDDALHEALRLYEELYIKLSQSMTGSGC
jgi:DNA topoisomerase IA